MTAAADLAIELDLDRAEAVLLSADASAWLVSAAAARLADRATAAADPSLRLRGEVLRRWSLAAQVADDHGVRTAAALPRDLPGLAARHAALRTVAGRLGYTPGSLAAAIHGEAPATITAAVDVSWPELDAPVPEAGELVAAVAAAHGLDTAGIDATTGAASCTVTVAPGHARITIGPCADALAHLALTLHEAGHALYRAQQRGMSLLAAAPPSRWFDEAVAAWAVRVLEDPAFVADPALRVAAAGRRAHREAVTAQLARFEAAVMDGVDCRDAWAATGLRDPAGFPALFDEPGVLASYAAADRMRLAPAPGELRAWALAGVAHRP